MGVKVEWNGRNWYYFVRIIWMVILRIVMILIIFIDNLWFIGKFFFICEEWV